MRYNTSRIKGWLWLVLLWGGIGPLMAQQIHEYTEDQPLVIVSDWEFPPYEFRNDKGQPDGYNVDMLNLILGRLHIPHRFLMQEWFQAVESFEKREGDIIHALSYRYKQRPYVMTRNMVHFYRVKSARLPSTPPLTHIGQLHQGDTIILRNNDYAAQQILLNNPSPEFTMEFHSPREALMGVRNGKYKYFLWGERPIDWKIKEFGLDSLVTDETDIPAGELRLIGYDKEIIDLIDDEFARLEQSGEIEKIRDKWFHPEKVHNDTSPISLFVITGAVIMLLIGFLLSRLIHTRVQAAVRKSIDLNNMMSQALGMGDFYVLVYDLESQTMVNGHGSLLPTSPMPFDEFISRTLPEQREACRTIISSIEAGKKDADLKVRWNAGTEEQPDWHYLHGSAILEREDEKPRYIVTSLKDVTHEIEAERATNEMGEKYIQMFKTNLIAMSFYGADGHLIDLNDKMRQLCEFDDQGEQFFRETNMFEVPMFRDDYDTKSGEELHACQRMHYPDLNIDKHIELRIKPVINSEGQIRYYTITARDLSDERIMYLEQRRHDLEMRKVNDEASNYETQLHYLLENSNMYVWHSDLKSGLIHFSRSLRNMEHTIAYKDYVRGLSENQQEDVFVTMSDNDMMGKPFNVLRHFNSTPLSHHPAWYAISGMPVHDEKGETVGQFGVVRDVTDLMEAQQKLKEETARAEDSGRLKSVFLANMTHEIRTPLNAIVGFSDLLTVIDNPEERMEFIRIIRNNCDMLLRLINDILEASSMGQALAIEPAEVEFAQVFDDICQTLAQRVQEPGVEFIKDNPYQSFRTVLDKGRVQQVLTNFTTNAVKYTHEGHIKVGYRAEERTVGEGVQKSGLFFYCEDTGAGIPKEKQASVFERFVKLNDFVQGTGLGLSICKSIADRCNGDIGVTSEGEGNGSTFWMWIPCERIDNHADK